MKKLKGIRFLSLLLAFVLLITTLTACGSDSSDSSEDEETTAAQADSEEETEEVEYDSEENTIRIATQDGQIRTAIYILAYELGYYEEEGVNVEFVNVSSTEALTAITTGMTDVDVLATGIVPSLTFIANGSDLLVFGGTAVEGGAIIAADDEIEYYEDFTNYEGITVAMVRGESSWTISRDLIIEAGVDVDSITIVEVDSQINVAQAVAKGEADVGFLPVEYANNALDLGIGIVYEVGSLEPEYVCCRQVTSSAKLEEKYDAFVKYMIANLRAWEYFEDEANREEVVSLIAEYSGQDEDYVEEYLFTNRTSLSLDPNEYGVIDYYNSLIDMDYFDSDDVDITEHIDTAVYAEALEAILERDPENEFFLEALEVYREYNDALI